jgi:tetratricopeptide (TPR) repeat protein
MAEEYGLRGLDFCKRINFLHGQISGNSSLGDIYFEIGDYQKSKDHCAKAIEISKQNRFWPSHINLNRIGVARAGIMNNEKDVDLESIYRYAAENRVRLFDGHMPRYIGEILLNIDSQHLVEAEDWIRKSIDADKGNGMVWHLGRDYALYAELLKRKGDQSKARENLNKAIEIFRECGADGWVEKYDKELTELI